MSEPAASIPSDPPREEIRPPVNRIVARDGVQRVVRIGLKTRWREDFFHALIRKSWGSIIIGVFGFLFLVNLAFAGIYLGLSAIEQRNIIENSDAGSLWEMYFFSVQTMATIGYGQLRPVGLIANFVASLEAFTGLLTFAMISGLLFAKFARPTAKVIFSHAAVVSTRNNRPCFMFRLANARGNQIVEGEVHVTLVRTENSSEGERFRHLIDLKLARERTPVFALTWTVVHYVDEHSPFFGETPASLKAKGVEIVVTFTGIDETLSQTVHSRHSYVVDEIRFGERLVDITSRDSGGRFVVDYTKFHETTHSSSVPANPIHAG